MKSRLEILSPAGSWESLRSAVFSGADAVYFGLAGFNARKRAQNFKNSDIAEIVSFCHTNAVKAYLTLNTIIYNNEAEEALKLAFSACDCGIDAIIVQDLGLAGLLHGAAPKLKLHASTQMSVHNKSGVLKLSELGFSRAVLARELTHGEMAEIASASPIELEVFVHGALCMSVSGQCYMSALFGGRSGNRGLCAQPCRLPFSCGNCENVLSLKDLSLLGSIGELNRMGIDSLKIEGRMKRPEYVACATSACFSAVRNGIIDAADSNRLKALFSRSGFTQGYFEDSRSREMFGTRGYDDVLASREQLEKLPKVRESSMPGRIHVKFRFTASVNGSSLEAEDAEGYMATVSGRIPERAVNRSLESAVVERTLSKTGGTPYTAESIDVKIEPGITLPVAELNRMRRNALHILLEKRVPSDPVAYVSPKTTSSAKVNQTFEKKPEIRFRCKSFGQVPQNINYQAISIIFFPVDEILNNVNKAEAMLNIVKIGVELPRLVFGNANESRIKKALLRVRRLGISDVLCGNLGVLQIALSEGFDVHGDFGLNVVNSYSVQSLADTGVKSTVLSLEANVRDIPGIVSQSTGVKTGLIVYGHVPLMLTRICPVKSSVGCQKSDCTITDRKHSHFRVLCTGGYTEILNDRPVWLADLKTDILKSGLDFVEFYYTIEDKADVSSSLSAWERSEKADLFTRGLYYHRLS